MTNTTAILSSSADCRAMPNSDMERRAPLMICPLKSTYTAMSSAARAKTVMPWLNTLYFTRDSPTTTPKPSSSMKPWRMMGASTLEAVTSRDDAL